MSCMSELECETQRVGTIGVSGFPTPVSRACVLVAIAALLVGCQREIEEGRLPAIPEPSLDSMTPEARGLIREFGARARATPNDGTASGQFGMALHAYEMNQASIACYRRAIALSPNEWQWPYYLGALYAELGRHGEAAAHLRAVVAMEPSPVTAKVRLGQSLSLKPYRLIQQAESTTTESPIAMLVSLLTNTLIENWFRVKHQLLVRGHNTKCENPTDLTSRLVQCSNPTHVCDHH